MPRMGEGEIFDSKNFLKTPFGLLIFFKINLIIFLINRTDHWEVI